MPIYERLQKLNHNPKTNTKKFKILSDIYLFIYSSKLKLFQNVNW